MAGGNKSSKSGSGSIGGVSFSYSSSGGKTSYNIGGKTYNSASAAANAIKNSSGFDSSKGLVRGSSGGGGTSGGGTKTITGGYMQNGKLYNEYSDGTTGLASEWKGGATGTSGGNTKTVTGGYMKNGKLYNEYSDGSSGLASDFKSTSGGGTSTLSSNISSNSNIDTKKKEDYTSASWENYTNAYNHYKQQGMSDADARNKASAFLEKENLLNNKAEQDNVAEMGPTNNQEEERDPMDTMNEVFYEDEDPYDYRQSQEWQDLMGDLDYYKNRVDELSSQLESNTVKTSIPEERDTSYDYNTYFKENLAPDTNYENGESKNTLNDKPQTTLVSQYKEPITTALNDLGLLTPNEEASADMPNTEEALAPAQYNSGEEIVSEFNNTLEQMGQEGGTGLSPQAVAQTYMEYKRKLDDYVNNNKLTAEEAEALLSQLKSNETLNNILRK